jgi:hypothetical protein
VAYLEKQGKCRRAMRTLKRRELWAGDGPSAGAEPVWITFLASLRTFIVVTTAIDAHSSQAIRCSRLINPR